MTDQSAIERVFDILVQRHQSDPEATMLASKPGRDWERLSVADVVARVDGVSNGLIDRGVEKGDRIGVLSSNRPEWNFVDLGGQQIGAVTVPLFPKMSADNYRHVLEQTEPEVVFVETRELLEKLRAAATDLPDERIFLFEAPPRDSAWSELCRRPDEAGRERLEERREAVEPDDLATIIYTSGTTGRPKGVMLSQRNLVSNMKDCMALTLPVGEGHRALSFLPLSHVFERQLNYVYMGLGVAIYYAREIDTIGEDMRDVKPHIFTTVPRLLQKVWERIEAEGREMEGLKARLFDWSVRLADDYELTGKGPFYGIQLAVARKLVFSRWRDGVGGEVRAVISGGASLSAELTRRFTAAGIDVLEGYGLTETSPVLSVNRYDKSRRRFGSVGKPLDSVRIRIADDDEIRCKGPNVTSGYYENPEATEEAFDEDGWFCTGDLGRLDEDGFLWIEDRKKSVFKTSGGKYVAPAEVENRLTGDALVEHAMLVGEDRKMVTALIQPAWGNLRDWCSRQGLEFDAREDMIELEEVRERFEQIVEEANRGFDETARVKVFELVPDEWSPESGELTPTMKVKRDTVFERYRDLVEGMYAQRGES